MMTRILDRVVDIVYNVSTGGVDSRTADHSRYRYSTISYASISRVLSRLRIAQGDTIVDIGCGKGRVLCVASRLGVSRVIGVEVSPDLVAACRRNASTLRMARSPIEVVEVAAEQFDYSHVSVGYLFNPFGADVLAAVLRRIVDCRGDASRGFRCAYVHPVHDSEFERSGCWRRLSVPDQNGYIHEHRVSYWECIVKSTAARS